MTTPSSLSAVTAQLGGQRLADARTASGSGRRVNSLRQPLEERGRRARGSRERLAVHRVVEHAELAAEVLDHALQAEADAEDREPALEQRVERAATRRSRSACPGPGESTTRSGSQRVELARREAARAASSPRRRSGAGSWPACGRTSPGGRRAARAGRAPGARRRRRAPPRRPRGRRRSASRNADALSSRLALLRVGIGVVEQRRARAHLGHAVLDADRAQGEARCSGCRRSRASPTAPPYQRARRALVVLDELHRPRLRRAGDGDRPGVARGTRRARRSPGAARPSTWSTVWISREYISIWRRPITRTLPGHADARLVVAVDVGAHRQLGLVLGRVEQRQDLRGVVDARRGRARSCPRSGRSRRGRRRRARTSRARRRPGTRRRRG